MGNGESTSRRIAMQRTDEGAIQISEDVMYRLKGHALAGQTAVLNEGETIIHEEQMKLMLEKAFLQGRKHEFEKIKSEINIQDKEKEDILKEQEQLRKDQEEEYKQKLIDLETDLTNKFREEANSNEFENKYKLELDEARTLLANEREKINLQNKSMTETVEKLVEEKNILENKVTLREQEIQQEFDKSVNDVQQRIRPLEQSQICTESQAKVLECYKQHKKQPLKCAREVKEFVDCVQETRLKFMQRHLIDGSNS